MKHRSCPAHYVGHRLLIDKAVADQSEGARSGSGSRLARQNFLSDSEKVKSVVEMLGKVLE